MPEELISSLEVTGIRLDAVQLFHDTCKVERITDIGTLNTSTAELESEVRSTIYTGECSLWPIMSRRDRFDEFGQGLIFTRQYRVTLPYTSDDIQQRDRFTLLTGDDTQAVGREMEVRDVVVSTILGYRRLTVQDTRE